LQFLVAGAAVWYLFDYSGLMPEAIRYRLALPLTDFYEHLFVLPPWLYLVFATFVIVGFSNAVNLTDGLDGLAIGPVASPPAPS
jgi:phospho-N-acetylmuramoyl-pentapeptide-transferase